MCVCVCVCVCEKECVCVTLYLCNQSCSAAHRFMLSCVDHIDVIKVEDHRAAGTDCCHREGPDAKQIKFDALPSECMGDARAPPAPRNTL